MRSPRSSLATVAIAFALVASSGCGRAGPHGSGGDGPSPNTGATSKRHQGGSSGPPTAATATTTVAPTASTAAQTKPVGPAAQPGQGRAKSVHLTLGIPTDANPADDLLVVKEQYALSYNPTRNDPNWVSWNLNASHFGPAKRFSGKFMPDQQLPGGVYRVRHEDYSGSGYDRGHMVRSEERTASDADNQATFTTTNLLPQYHDLNAGPWLRLEEYCQHLAQRGGKELYIVAGGIFSANPPTIGKGVAVPDATFKIVVVLERGQGLGEVTPQTRVIAASMPNKKGIQGEGWGQYRTTVDEIERQTGYDFLPEVPEAAQRAVEGRIDTGPTQ